MRATAGDEMELYRAAPRLSAAVLRVAARAKNNGRQGEPGRPWKRFPREGKVRRSAYFR